LFAGVQNYATNLIQITGVTEVSPSAYAWVSQHPNYNGFKVHISGTYPTLEPWYFIQWEGPGCQQQAMICFISGGDAYACTTECNPH
jgi:hypothetical protein